MMITIKTTVSFDPVAEYDDIKQFIASNDMTEWEKTTSTVATTFTKTNNYLSRKGDCKGGEWRK